jgi:hypothetical protein
MALLGSCSKDQLDVDQVEALIGLGQEFAQQFVHGNPLAAGNASRAPRAFRERGQPVGKWFKTI